VLSCMHVCHVMYVQGSTHTYIHTYIHTYNIVSLQYSWYVVPQFKSGNQWPKTQHASLCLCVIFFIGIGYAYFCMCGVLDAVVGVQPDGRSSSYRRSSTIVSFTIHDHSCPAGRATYPTSKSQLLGSK
jgi:hypothetical protein